MSLSSGGASCAVRSDRSLWCWGYDQQGASGMASPSAVTCPNLFGEQEPCVPTPSKVDIPPVASVDALGYSTVCARTVTGEVFCWGSNHAGVLGQGSAEGPDSCAKGSGASDPSAVLQNPVDRSGRARSHECCCGSGLGLCDRRVGPGALLGVQCVCAVGRRRHHVSFRATHRASSSPVHVDPHQLP